MTKFLDRVTISGTRIREDGYLVADARVARTGIQYYAGFEVGKPSMEMVAVYRPEDEVFSQDTMASFAHRPITNDHPPEAVVADNWKKYSVGNTVDEVARDGQFLRVPLMVADGESVNDIKSGKRELSAGYSADLEWTSGVTEDGIKYDAVQRNIKANHVAIVDRGRAGKEVRIGDNWDDAVTQLRIVNGLEVYDPRVVDERKRTEDMDLVKITFDGISIETTDQGKQAIDKLTKQLADSTAALSDKDKELATKDVELAKKDAELEKLREEKMDDAALDALVQARGDLISVAKSICPEIKTAGLSDHDIRKTVVVDKLGEKIVEGKTEVYIDARFDALAEDAKSEANSEDSIRGAIGNLRVVGDADSAKLEKDAHQRYLDRMTKKKSA